jgi:MFS family permease
VPDTNRQTISAEVPDDGRFSSRLIWLIAFMWGAYFLNYSDRICISAMLDSLRSDLQMTELQLGLIGSIFLWVYGIGCPVAGLLADRFSKRRLVVASLVIWSLVTALTGLAANATMLLGLRAAMGISEAMYMPAAIALTAGVATAAQRSRAVSILTTAQVAGTIAGAWFGGWMAEQGWWRAAFGILGVLGMLYAIPYFAFLKTIEEPRPTVAAPGRRQFADSTVAPTQPSPNMLGLARVPSFGLLCIIFPIFVFGLWMLYAWLPDFLRAKFSLGQGEAGFTFGIYLQPATLVGLILGGYLADYLRRYTRAARMWVLLLSLVLSAPAIHFIGNATSLTSTAMALVSYGLFGGLLMGNIFPAAFDVVPESRRASAVGVLNFFGAILSGFAPLVVGQWKQSIPMEQWLTLTAAAYLMAALLVLLLIYATFPHDYRRNQTSLDLLQA